MTELNTTLGARLKSARIAAGMSQADLSRRLQVTAVSVWRWENDRKPPSRDRVMRIARELSVSVDWLLGVGAAA